MGQAHVAIGVTFFKIAGLPVGQANTLFSQEEVMAEWHVLLNNRIIDKFWIKEGDTVSIGRGKTADVSIDNAAVSRRHATLEMRNGEYLLTDLKSVNGTRVNGHKIEGATPITAADRIEIGKFRFVVAQISEDSYPAYAMVRTSEAELARLPDLPTDFEGTVFVVPRRLALVEGKATPERLSLKEKPAVTLGKDAACDVCVPGGKVGKIQCQILAKGDQHYLVHQAGWKRTTVNGKKISGEQRLRKGDTIGIGGSKIRFE